MPGVDLPERGAQRLLDGELVRGDAALEMSLFLRRTAHTNRLGETGRLQFEGEGGALVLLAKSHVVYMGRLALVRSVAVMPLAYKLLQRTVGVRPQAVCSGNTTGSLALCPSPLPVAI